VLTPQIILLAGTSSSGKSTLAKALQKRLPEPYLHVCIDTFEEMVPVGIEFGGEHTQKTIFNKMLSGFHHSLAAMASCGNNLITDHVLVEGEEPLNWVSECLTLLSPYHLIMVGVHCPLEELERRELARGDRPAGLARWQFIRMHEQVVYDIEVDTHAMTVDECVEKIIALLS
jgi:chloramphenicol 3-O phosphotransferase